MAPFYIEKYNFKLLYLWVLNNFCGLGVGHKAKFPLKIWCFDSHTPKIKIKSNRKRRWKKKNHLKRSRNKKGSKKEMKEKIQRKNN